MTCTRRIEGCGWIRDEHGLGRVQEPGLAKIKSLMKGHVVFDGRNLYRLSDMKNMGFAYEWAVRW